MTGGPLPQNIARVWLIVPISIAVLALCATGSQQIVLTFDSQPSHQKPLKTGFRSFEWRTVDNLPQPIAQFNSVFWEPRDTDSLRKRIGHDELVRGKSVLEIGTGTGLIAICCLQAGAERVVATDVNRIAIGNAQYNAEILGVADRLDARLVPLTNSTAFSVIRAGEQFDLIVSNPPWENDRPKTIAEFALYDPDFQLLHSLLADGRKHLKTGGRLWLAYGCTEAIREIVSSAPRYGWQVKWLDDRKLSELPAVFLPGLLLELTPKEVSR